MHEGDVLPDAFVLLFQLFENEVRVGTAEAFEDFADGFHRSAGAEAGGKSDEKAHTFGSAVGDDGGAKSGLRRSRSADRRGMEDSFGSVHGSCVWKNKNRLSVRRGGWSVRSD